MKTKQTFVTILVSSLFLSACSTIPESSTVRVLPGSKKNYSTYLKDKQVCSTRAAIEVEERYSSYATNQKTNDNIVIGTIIGGILGSVFGGRHKSVARGAVSGGIIGGLTTTDDFRLKKQIYYDSIYSTCMYEAGHKVPSSSIIYIEKEKFPLINNPQKEILPKNLPINSNLPESVSPYGVPPDFKPSQ
ncbi:MAG: hypothetical protein HQL46_01990 [Gammaproteobacteria bacterium]|nr:hypothetical protein [Gammaproteobacteria bacterium]